MSSKTGREIIKDLETTVYKQPEKLSLATEHKLFL